MSDAEKKPEEESKPEEPVAGTLLACGATDWYSIGRRYAADCAVTRGGPPASAGPLAAARMRAPTVAAAAGADAC